MKKEELNKIFTQKVKEYLDNGYIIHTNSMYGSNGTSRIDMVKGYDFVRVFFETTYRNAVRIEMLCTGHKTLSKAEKLSDTIWQSGLYIVKEAEVYCLEANKWYVTADEYAVIRKKQRDRQENAYVSEKLWRFLYIPNQQKAKQIVLPFITRQPRCKTYKASDISSVTKLTTEEGVTYRIVAKGHQFILNERGNNV